LLLVKIFSPSIFLLKIFPPFQAAIEALTKDSILHRRDVKTLVKQHKDRGKEEKGKAEAAAKAANKSQTKLVTENGTTTTNNSKLTPIDIFNSNKNKIVPSN